MQVLAARHGSDLLNSRVVPSSVILPSVPSVTTLRINIAVSKNRVATISAVTDTVRYCFDALYIKPLPAMRCESPQGHTKAVTESQGHLVAGGRRSGGAPQSSQLVDIKPEHFFGSRTCQQIRLLLVPKFPVIQLRCKLQSAG